MESDFQDQLRHYLELSKLKIMIPVSLTGFTGFFLYNQHEPGKAILVTMGILLLSVSASVLNQIQEVKTDRIMERTRLRPIPAGKIKPENAFLYFVMTLAAGFAVLLTAGGIGPALIGIATIIWYNGVYTYSKRITAFAVVPGALTGALPPLIGWVAAGGGAWDHQIIFVEFLFFVGQIPHFWLLLLKYGDEYESAGLPSLTTVMRREQINRLTFTWVVTSVMAALFLCFFEIIHTLILSLILFTASAFLVWRFSGLIRSGAKNGNQQVYSFFLYAYYLLLIILLIADRIIA
jgi:protoheme IX farnesyltransferase